MTTTVSGPAASAVVPILQCNDVRKSYGGIHALRGVELAVRPGVVHGLVGPNGAGKSTLVKVIAGAVTPTTGDVRFAGALMGSTDPRVAARLGIVLIPQEMTMLPNMTVAENITLGAEPTRYGFRQRKAALARAETALEALSLDIPVRSFSGDLSPTMQRLVMLATAFDRRARLVILDEPTAGLPPHEAELVLDAVEGLRRQGVAVIYVSHHFSEVARVCAEVTCIREGRNAGYLEGDDVTKENLVALIHDASLEGPGRRAQREAGETEVSAIVRLEEVSTGELRNVTVCVPSEGVVGIAGLLGSGAKDLAAVMSGGLLPNSGQLFVDDELQRGWSPTRALARGVTYLAGDRSRSALRLSTIRENVSISALQKWTRAGLINGRAERRAVVGNLELLDVKASMQRSIGELSGGNQQRALVARCLAADARLVVLDEPTVGVDVASREDLWSAIRVMGAGRAVVVASSDPEELVAVCDRVVCVAHGEIVEILQGRDVTEKAITRAIS